ncbi:MAG: hypothetical protein ACNS60_11365 [Candidatus Cyclobacteriaceae bacterium M2_1C_046]
MNSIKTSRILLTLCLLTVAFYAAGQKANTKNVYVKYIQPPLKPLPPNVKTYIFLQQNNVSNFNITEHNQKRLSLPGYEKVNSSVEADLMIRIKIHSIKFDGQVAKQTYRKKINDSTYVDKIGGVYTVKAGMRTSSYIKDLRNDKVIHPDKPKTIDKTFTSTTYSTYNEAVAAYNKQKDAQAMKVANEILNDVRVAFQNSIINNHGYASKSTIVDIARGKGRKHDYSDLEQAYEEFDGAVELINETGLTEELEKIIYECIDVWRAAIKQYEPDNKKARIGDKNIGSLYYNIAAAKFVLQKYYLVYPLLDTVASTKGQGMAANRLRTLCNELEMRHDQEPTYALGPDENIQRLNYSLIYNLFMNYELTEKHQNLQVLMSYFPDYDHLPAKEININSENSGFLEKIRWVYDEEGDLTDFTYEVDREEGQYVMYTYELDYEGYELKGIDIAGERKIDFEYFGDGRLKTISRKKNNVVLQYTLEYAEEGNKAAVKLVVINGEEMRPSSANYFVVWNEKMKITDYNLDVYAGSKFEYSENGDLISQTFKGMDDDVTVSWEYEYDEKGKWTTMKYGSHASFKRVIN